VRNGLVRRAARHAAKAARCRAHRPHEAGRLVNQIKKLAWDVGELPDVARSTDPTDDFLLSMSEAGQADYLATGDKSGLLAFDRHKTTRIVFRSDFATLFAPPKKARLHDGQR
jgi:predicted nucleic acid-binding protein